MASSGAPASSNVSLNAKMIRKRLGLMLLAVTAMVATSAEPAAAIQCQARKGGDGYWSWRLVDRRKCWYVGSRRIDKSLLHWTTAQAQERLMRERPSPSRVQPPADSEPPWPPLEQPDTPPIRIIATRPMHEDVQSHINDTFDTSLPSGAVTYREPRPLKIERPAEPKRGWLVGLAALVCLVLLGFGVNATKQVAAERL